MTEVETRSEEETVSAGRELGRRLQAGDVVLLEGPLGAGKTAFVRGLAEGLGLSGDAVSSPTFTIVQEYRSSIQARAGLSDGEARGAVTLQHIDLYRLSPAEVDDLALDDLLDDAVVAVEWPDRWHRAPENAVRVTIEVLAGNERRITTH
jgi:tRNA threonylcarbamoyladenosine biosynthesis protein TsaE